MARRRPADTPLMRQFLEVKENHPDGIVFFRMGDFYEMFFDDAVVAARLLDLTLTSRDKGKEDAIPMAGVPHHAAHGYIARLTELGHKVVLVEQVEDPKQAKGLVKREVVRIITPGVVLDDEVLDPRSARYVAAVVPAPGRRPGEYGLAYLDASTGEFRATELGSLDQLVSELCRVGPRELVTDGREFGERGRLASLRRRFPSAVLTAFAALDEEASAEALGAEFSSERTLASQAAATVLAYARSTQPTGTLPVRELGLYRPGESVVLDEAAVANLELTETLIGARRQGSLLATIDRTQTSPGARLLRRWLLYPLTELDGIRRRQDAVEFFFEHETLRAEIRDMLRGVADLERLCGRFSLGVGTPRDLGRLRDSLGRLPALAERIDREASETIDPPGLCRLSPDCLKPLAVLHGELAAALADEPPPTLREGGLIRDGFCPEVDESRRLAVGGKDAILAIEARERQATGISTLKVKYNKVFGYYIEVTRSQLARVPDHYVRKQTIATGERYVTPELAELEGKILAAEETLKSREQVLFQRLCKLVAEAVVPVMAAAERVATIDVCAGLAEAAREHRYVRPLVEAGTELTIREGRHPVVEGTVDAGTYVPNDCSIGTDERQVLLITGPNMAGKSTYMRQVAHIVLLAQMGGFVPAAEARIGLVDRIFTRVGAADNLARGESTFMVEMRETASILSGATERSLVVLDEIGRGTSTYDGVSIAWAVAEHLHERVGCRTLFATHYHELCALAELLPRVENVSVAVKEQRGKIVFLRQVVEGGADRSYGIEVARLAGLPPAVLRRARHLLSQLEGRRLAAGNQLDLFAAGAPAGDATSAAGADIAFDAEEEFAAASESFAAAARPILERLGEIDPNHVTPIEALTLLAEVCGMASGVDA